MNIGSTSSSPPYFIKYYILRNGQLKEIRWIDLTKSADPTRLVFNPDGRIVYLPQAGFILEFHVGTNGNIITPYFSSAPVGPMPTRIVFTSDRRFAYVNDNSTLWQYSVTRSGLLKPLNPPSISMNGLSIDSIVESQNHYVYVFSVTPGIVYQSPNSQKIMSLYKIAESGCLIPIRPASMNFHINSNLINMVIDGRQPYLYMSTPNKLIIMKIKRNGGLAYLSSMHWNKPGVYRICVDHSHGYLYLAGSYDAIHIFRIQPDGYLVPVNVPYPHTGTSIQDMMIVTTPQR